MINDLLHFKPMPPIVFITLEAIILRHREVAFRSLLALRRFGIPYDIGPDEEYVCRGVLRELQALVAEHAPRFVITSVYDGGLGRAHMQAHLRAVGLSVIADSLDEHWRTAPGATGIQSWLAKYASAQASFVAIGVDDSTGELEEPGMAEHSVLVGERLNAGEGVRAVKSILRHQTTRGQNA